MRSITFIPVNKTSVDVESCSKGGASLWIGKPFSSLLGKFSIPSIASPITLNKRPYISLPIGICIGFPVDNTSAPLCSPSVESIEIVLTISSPTWDWTSKTRIDPSSFLISRESYILGNSMLDVSNETSTTGPIIWETLPNFSDITKSLIYYVLLEVQI